MVVYILTKAVEYDFKVDNFQSFHRIGKMSPTHIHLSSRQRIADQISIVVAEDMINISNPYCFEVQSFTNAPQSYSININPNSKMISCSCPDWQQHQLACKHMFLIARIHNNIELPDIINTIVPSENIIHDSSPVDPSHIQIQREFVSLLRRVDRQFQRSKDDPNMTEDIIHELIDLGHGMESILERFNSRRAFIHQDY